MLTTLKWWVFNMRRRIPRRRATIKFMSQHLILAADTIDELRRENQMLRIRGNLLATAIDNNDWTVEYADKLCDAAAAWREVSLD